MAYDLILRTPPTQYTKRSRARTVTRDLSDHPLIGCYCEITEGATEASAVDVIGLDEFICDGSSSEVEFTAFCVQRGVIPNRQNKAIAAVFLDSKWGVILAFVKLPPVEADVVAVYAELIKFARDRGIRIVDPQIGRDVDLNDPGKLPAIW
jgi:hypothetical protein